MVCAAVDKVHEEIAKSARPKMPMIWSEFNATYMNEQAITDSIYMGPWLADTISEVRRQDTDDVVVELLRCV